MAVSMIYALRGMIWLLMTNLVRAGEIGNMALYLFSDAATWVTGQVFVSRLSSCRSRKARHADDL